MRKGMAVIGRMEKVDPTLAYLDALTKAAVVSICIGKCAIQVLFILTVGRQDLIKQLSDQAA